MIGRIREAFDARLQTLWTGDIAWEAVSYDPQSGVPYLVPRMPGYDAMPMGIGANTPSQHNGVYQVVVVWPRSAGVIAPADMAVSVRDHFKRGTTMTVSGHSLLVTRSVIRPPIVETDWTRTPVVVEWIIEEPAP